MHLTTLHKSILKKFFPYSIICLLIFCAFFLGIYFTKPSIKQVSKLQENIFGNMYTIPPNTRLESNFHDKNTFIQHGNLINIILENNPFQTGNFSVIGIIDYPIYTFNNKILIPAGTNIFGKIFRVDGNAVIISWYSIEGYDYHGHLIQSQGKIIGQSRINGVSSTNPLVTFGKNTIDWIVDKLSTTTFPPIYSSAHDFNGNINEINNKSNINLIPGTRIFLIPQYNIYLTSSL